MCVTHGTRSTIIITVCHQCYATPLLCFTTSALLLFTFSVLQTFSSTPGRAAFRAKLLLARLPCSRMAGLGLAANSWVVAQFRESAPPVPTLASAVGSLRARIPSFQVAAVCAPVLLAARAIQHFRDNHFSVKPIPSTHQCTPLTFRFFSCSCSTRLSVVARLSSTPISLLSRASCWATAIRA